MNCWCTKEPFETRISLKSSNISTKDELRPKGELQKYFCKIEICDRALITLVVEVTIKVFRRCSGLIGLGIDWKVFEKTFHISRLPGGAKLFNEFLLQTIFQ